MFNKGMKVEQVVAAPISGTVESFSICQETGTVLVKVVWPTEDGVQHERYFTADEIKEVV